MDRFDPPPPPSSRFLCCSRSAKVDNLSRHHEESWTALAVRSGDLDVPHGRQQLRFGMRSLWQDVVG
jgi:hypothetical protein